MPIVPPDWERISAVLPSGYRARAFDDADREPFVADRNAEVSEMERGDAHEWREWEKIRPPKDRLRIVAVAPDGAVAGSGEVGPPQFTELPDGAFNGGVGVLRAHRRRGLGTALLAAIETETRRRGAPRLLASANVASTGSLDWALARGFREIGRRIESYVDATTFDATPFGETVDRVRASGIRLVTFAERLAGADAARREAFWHELHDAEGPMWDDVPWATPTPHWSYEAFHQLAVESGRMIEEASMVALDGDRIVGLTTTGRARPGRGYTWMTGTARSHRGQGLAVALKVVMLERAKAAGIGPMFTTNDEPNKAMRGINARLGYVMLPAHVELEKTL